MTKGQGQAFCSVWRSKSAIEDLRAIEVPSEIEAQPKHEQEEGDERKGAR
ncbi:hypothetical protein [Caballeronia fortuita]|nr:hypothetical protein [Caballeronia fortuita]